MAKRKSVDDLVQLCLDGKLSADIDGNMSLTATGEPVKIKGKIPASAKRRPSKVAQRPAVAKQSTARVTVGVGVKLAVAGAWSDYCTEHLPPKFPRQAFVFDVDTGVIYADDSQAIAAVVKTLWADFSALPLRKSRGLRIAPNENRPMQIIVHDPSQKLVCVVCDDTGRVLDEETGEPEDCTACNSLKRVVVFKHEGEQRGIIVGPVWIQRDGKLAPYENGERRRDGTYFPAWFTLANARKIARKLKLPLEEV